MAEPIVLYVVPASHPCRAVEAGLALKRFDYCRVDLMFGVSAAQQAFCFGARTVSGITIGRQKVVGSRLILCALDGFQPDPPFVPRDPDLRSVVDAADEWGDLVLQEQVRWITLVHGIQGRPEVFRSFTAGYKVPNLPGWAIRRGGAGVQLEMRLLGYSDAQVRDEFLPALPGHIDHVDRLIAEGVIGGEVTNVADFQIASLVRLLLNFDDFWSYIEDRFAGLLVWRLIFDYAGSVPVGSVRSLFG